MRRGGSHKAKAGSKRRASPRQILPHHKSQGHQHALPAGCGVRTADTRGYWLLACTQPVAVTLAVAQRRYMAARAGWSLPWWKVRDKGQSRNEMHAGGLASRDRA